MDSCRSKICISVSDLIESIDSNELCDNLINSIEISNFLIKDTIQKLLNEIRLNINLIQYLTQIKKLTFYTINDNPNKYVYIVANNIFDFDSLIIEQLNNLLPQSLCFYTEDESNKLLIDETLLIEFFSSSTQLNKPQLTNIEQSTKTRQLVTIKRHLNSFYQTDEQQREKIHNIICEELTNCLEKCIDNKYVDCKHIDSSNTNTNTIIFLGGEMYIYGKIFDNYFSKKIYITDTESLYEDAMLNDPCPSKSIYNLVSYKVNNFLLETIEHLFDQTQQSNQTKFNIQILLSNISKTGLGELICNQIMIIKPKYLILITCNYKVTLRDISMLNIYKLNKIIKISTTYDVFITVLENTE